MSRLHLERTRLYHPTPGAPGDADALVDAQARTRALVLELARPADWGVLSAVWQGVQAELGLPAPGIAVSGTEGMQLWFSLHEPVRVAQGHAFVAGLRRRYLVGVDPSRVRLVPGPDGSAAAAPQGWPVPALHAASGNWSAFVAPDLAPLFAETPWLDVPPGDEGQAALLAGLASIDAGAFAAALAQLSVEAPSAVAARADGAAAAFTHPVADAGMGSDPVRFLLGVMNDAAVPLALRIEAAKALLPHMPRNGQG